MTDNKIKVNSDCIMPFGKYRGLNISSIPSSYIAWLLKQDIVKGTLRVKIEECIKEKYKDAWLDKALREWICSNYSVKSYASRCSCAVAFNSDLYDAMDGCLPNQ